jgi:hypothetical protein
VLLPARPFLLLLHFQAEHRRLRRGSQGNGVGHTMLLRLPCHADPPRSRASGNRRSHVTGRGRMRWSASRQNARESAKKRSGMVGLALRQNTGRNPEGRQRAASARDDGASANRVQVLQGQYSCQRTCPAAGTARARLSASDSRGGSLSLRVTSVDAFSGVSAVYRLCEHFKQIKSTRCEAAG